MQEKIKERRSNRERSEDMRANLIRTARHLFVKNGYNATGTPEIVSAASVTRGALYHHFADKADLFRAVVVAEAEAVAAEIEASAATATSPIEALEYGAAAYFKAMAVPGRAHLLLVEGPAVLGVDTMAEIDRVTGGGTLKAGLAAAAQSAGDDFLAIEEAAVLLSAVFDRAAYAIAQGGDTDRYRQVVRRLLNGLFTSGVRTPEN
ncbi:TetR/AcrR family transcriptional regulator [Rhodospirillaceae bacterium KN72]|uniref:TetR/AcrR family transcriptional regulator n=1 Tax=Pacificispira spongiicola TaxID=2729598 RepID=A0A7Y0E119_9PROT|nr:TetR/AcrR family transcriptional regulator [Pacificispira spongiicola]NMM45287.1 TetR/AcrR family transcriptional regulator [Pacificispira spongiicola]